MIKRLAKHHFLGRARYQRVWERLYHLSLAGMNIGTCDTTLDPGEIWVLDLVKRKLRGSNLVVFDVGAHGGKYSQQVLACLGKDARIYCFEPSGQIYRLLCDAFRQCDNVECLNFGLGQDEEKRTLYTYAGHSGFASLYDRGVLNANLSNNPKAPKLEETVTVRTLDSFCESRRIDHINLLKLDVEGHELSVLKGAQRLIQEEMIDFIQFEFGGTQIDSRTFMYDFHQLLDQNFKINRVLKDGLAPVIASGSTDEIFVYGNYLAVSRRLSASAV